MTGLAVVRRVLERALSRPASFLVSFERRNPGWLDTNLPKRIRPPRTEDGALIETRARQTERAGMRPLWAGYAEISDYPFPTTGFRSSNQVRTDELMGRVFFWLARKRHPLAIVEIGSAFGISGMYWLSGMKCTGQGRLFAFEPNEDWASLAEANLRSISPAFTLIKAPFEDRATDVLSGVEVGIAFIDAIHTSAFVLPQYALVKRFMSPGGLVVLDDINFSADMQNCWSTIAHLPEVRASARIGDRVGVVELTA